MGKKMGKELNHERHEKHETKKGVVPKLRFPEFRGSAGWEIEELGSKTTKVGSGITPSGGDKNYTKNGRPFVRSQNVGWGCLILDDVAFIDESTHASFQGTEIQLNDVLLNITGASIGRSAVANKAIEGGNVNQHVCIIRTNPKQLDSLYLNQYLISNSGQKLIDSFQAGGNRQGLNFAQIKSFVIPLPPWFPEQQRIADCISSLDALIAAHSQKLDGLKTYKKGLMQQLFPAKGETVPKLRFPEFRKSGEWEEKTLSDVAAFTSGGTPSKDNSGYWGGNIPWISASSMYDYSISKSDLNITELAVKDGAKIAQKGTLLILVRGSMLYKRIPMGICVIDVAFNQDVKALTINNSAPRTDFLMQQLVSKESRLLAMVGDTGIGAGKLDTDDLKKIAIQIPTPAEQQRIASFLTSIDNLITAQSQKIESLKTHKKGLMQQLFPAMEDVAE